MLLMGSDDAPQPSGPCRPLWFYSRLYRKVSQLHRSGARMLHEVLMESRVGERFLFQLCKDLCNKKSPANYTHTR